MTNEEARGKWCPWSRTELGQTGVVINRFGYDQDVPEAVLRQVSCIGSGCMAWRSSLVNPGDGYCGLAGAMR